MCVCTYDRFAENVNLFGCDDVDVFETLKLKPLLLLGLMLVDVKSNPVLFPLDGVGFNIDDDPIANIFDELLANEFWNNVLFLALLLFSLLLLAVCDVNEKIFDTEGLAKLNPAVVDDGGWIDLFDVGVLNENADVFICCCCCWLLLFMPKLNLPIGVDDVP